MSQYKVVHVWDDECKIAINAGANKNIDIGDRFLLYELSDHEILDPDTKESLGFLEMVKGTGTVTNVQEKMCTIESNMFKTEPIRTVRKGSNIMGFSTTEERTSTRTIAPFNSPKNGDLVKEI